MEIHAPIGEVIINILVQLFNIALFFFLVIRFMAKPIAQSIEARIEKEKKLSRADESYKEMIAEAKKEAQHIVGEATDHRRRLVEEAVEVAQQRAHEITETAERKAEEIKTQAAVRSAEMKRELEESFTDSVKHTSELVVQKLLGSKKDLQDEYLNTLVNELTHDKKSHETH